MRSEFILKCSKSVVDFSLYFVSHLCGCTNKHNVHCVNEGESPFLPPLPHCFLSAPVWELWPSIHNEIKEGMHSRTKKSEGVLIPRQRYKLHNCWMLCRKRAVATQEKNLNGRKMAEKSWKGSTDSGEGGLFVDTQRVAERGMEGKETKRIGHPPSWRSNQEEWKAMFRLWSFTAPLESKWFSAWGGELGGSLSLPIWSSTFYI